MTTPHATNSQLTDLSAAGVTLWLDDLSWQRLQSGNPKELIENTNIVGLATNPSIFRAALKAGSRSLSSPPGAPSSTTST